MEIYEDPADWKRPIVDRKWLRRSAQRFAYENGLILSEEEAEVLFTRCYPDWGFAQLSKEPGAVLDCSHWGE